MSSKLKELKTSKKELREKHDKLEGIHNELTTSYNLLKEEYTNLKINHDNLVLSCELLFNEPHDATNNIVKIDIATSCDDLIIESIEQNSSSKGKQVVETDSYDEYVKLKNDNENLKKDLEEIKSHNTIVLETLDHDGDLMLRIRSSKKKTRSSRKRKTMMHSKKRTRSSSWRKSILRLD